MDESVFRSPLTFILDCEPVNKYRITSTWRLYLAATRPTTVTKKCFRRFSNDSTQQCCCTLHEPLADWPVAVVPRHGVSVVRGGILHFRPRLYPSTRRGFWYVQLPHTWNTAVSHDTGNRVSSATETVINGAETTTTTATTTLITCFCFSVSPVQTAYAHDVRVGIAVRSRDTCNSQGFFPRHTSWL